MFKIQLLKHKMFFLNLSALYFIYWNTKLDTMGLGTLWKCLISPCCPHGKVAFSNSDINKKNVWKKCQIASFMSAMGKWHYLPIVDYYIMQFDDFFCYKAFFTMATLLIPLLENVHYIPTLFQQIFSRNIVWLWDIEMPLAPLCYRYHPYITSA